MAQSFTCPSCGAPLDYDGSGQPTIPCPYCFTSVIVPQELRFQKAATVSPDITLALMGQATRLRELANLARARQIDQAADLYQQIYQVSRADALRVVQQLAEGRPAVIASSASAASDASSLNPSAPPAFGAGSANYSGPPVRVYSAP